jgi:Ca-activated chloride channel family protein
VSETPSDPALDALVRNVPLPSNLADRVKAALVPTDEQLDASLKAVELPGQILDRLKEIPQDVALDEALADVPHPLMLAGALRKTSAAEHLRRGGRRLARWAAAACWFVALYASLVGCIALIIGGVYPRPVADEFELMAIYDGPLSVEGELAASALIQQRAPGSDQQIAGTAANTPQPVPVSLADIDLHHRPGPVAEWNSLVSAGLRPMDDVVLLRFGVLGSPNYTDDHLPDLAAPIPLRSSGLTPPMVRAFNRPFFVKHGIYPPVAPTVQELARLQVPLVAESDLLTRLERAAADKRTVGPSELAVEEFVAALDYHYVPAPHGRLAIRTAAGPAIFAPQGAGLLQIGVQAGGLATREQASTHLVLAIDLSHSMGRGGRLEMVRHGINKLLDQLTPADRLSLVIFNEQVIHHVELASRDDAPAIRRLLAELSPRGGTNLAAGLQQAASLAMLEAAGSSAQRLVLITDSTGDMPAATLDQVRQMLVVAREAGVQLDVLDVSDRTQVDSALADLATNMGGEARAVTSQRQMAWSLIETLAGQSPVVATEARLALQFNPRSVKAYRLVGHESSALASLKPAALEAELAVGESATTLVEIWFQPGEFDDVGFAELTWHDAQHREQRLRQRISRLQFAPTFDQAPLPLQMATIAAEIGHELRHTREALREVGLPPVASRGLADVLSAAQKTHPQLREREDFQRLLRVTQSLSK